MEHYVLGIDGGQSSTVCALARLDGTVVGAGTGGPVNHVSRPEVRARMIRSLRDAVLGAFDAAGLLQGGYSHGSTVSSGVPPAADVPPASGIRLASGVSVDAAYLGLTGGVELAPGIVRELVQVDKVKAESDVVCALAGGTAGQSGIVVLAGTGSVAYGENARGQRASRGGWGYLLGDVGSGWWLGLEALRAAAWAEDGVRPTELLPRILEHFRAPGLREVASRVYAGQLDRSSIAALAPLVLEAAAAGDPVATAIVATAADALADLAEAVSRALPLGTGERIIVGQGGVLRSANPLWQALAARLVRRLPDFRLQAPRFPPVLGSVLLALRLAGITVDDAILARLDSSSRRWPRLSAKTAPA